MKKLIYQIFIFFKSKKDLKPVIDENFNDDEYTDEDYIQLCELYFKHPWLAKEANHLGLEKLWSDYKKPEEKFLLKTLLSNFTYLTLTESEHVSRKMLEKCTSDWQLSPKTTIFVTIKQHDYADGSSAFLHLIKGVLRSIESGYREGNFIDKQKAGEALLKDEISNDENNVDEITIWRKKWESNRINIKNVVLIDDFVGTGDTAFNRISEFQTVITNSSADCNLYFISLASMKQGVAKIKETGIEARTCEEFEKGIDISFRGKSRSKNRLLMIEMENILSDKINDKKRKKYILGWKGSEALYSWDRFNVPNNVFPVLWWEKYKDEGRRKTLFNRMQ